MVDDLGKKLGKAKPVVQSAPLVKQAPAAPVADDYAAARAADAASKPKTDRSDAAKRAWITIRANRAAAAAKAGKKVAPEVSPGHGDQSVAAVVKTYAAAAGLDAGRFAGHSLSAGLVTQAAINGLQELAITKQSRHKSSDMLRKYIRDASIFRDNASARVGP